jgi:2-oxoglutarate ferredoxin oxidoreductase subunit alpha
MIITHHGAECIKLQAGDTVLGFNPISKDSKLKAVSFGADIAFVSVNHPDMNGAAQLSRGEKEAFIIKGPGEYEVASIFALFAGHGEFPKIVLAPGDIEEMYQLSAEAFNLADIYQTPVIVMSDKHLGESHWSISKKEFNTFAQEYVVDRGKITTSVPQDEPYLRYKVTDDGISPMLIPGQKGVFFQANSYEHVEDGHTTEDGQETIAQTDKRNRKLETYLMGHYKGPNIYGDTRMATHIFVTWGSIKGTILDAMKKLEEEGTMCALVHFTHMWPLDKYKVTDILTSKSPKQKWILVENNSHAQFASVIRMTTGIDFKHKLLKYDGRQIFVEDIIDFVQALTGLKEQK